MGRKRKRRGHKGVVSSDIRRLKERPAVPGMIRLTDGGFADRLAGKYTWRTAGRFARGEMVHRMREQARTPEAISVQLHLMLRQVRLMVPLHLRIDWRAPALRPSERQDPAARRTDGVRRELSPADGERSRRRASGASREDGRRDGAGRRRTIGPEPAQPVERRADRLSERLVDRQIDRLTERRIDRLPEGRIDRLAGRYGERSYGTGGERRAAPGASGRSAVSGRLPAVTDGIPSPYLPGWSAFPDVAFRLPAARAYRLLAAAVRTPLFGLRGDGEPGGRLEVRPASSAPELLHQQPVRIDASSNAALQAQPSAPRPGAQSRPEDDRPSGRRARKQAAGREAAPQAEPPAASRPTVQAARRLSEERTEPSLRRPSVEPNAPAAARRSVPAAPAVSVSAAPLAMFARSALRAGAFPAAAPVSKALARNAAADGADAAAGRGLARLAAARRGDAARPADGADRPLDGAGRPDGAGPALPYIAAGYRQRQRQRADGQQATIVHRTGGARTGREDNIRPDGIRSDGIRAVFMTADRLERIVRLVRQERTTLVRASLERMLRIGSRPGDAGQAPRMRPEAAGQAARDRSDAAARGASRRERADIPGERFAPSAQSGTRIASASAARVFLFPADREPAREAQPVVRRSRAASPVNLSHAAAPWRAAFAAADVSAASAAGAAARLAAEASVRAALNLAAESMARASSRAVGHAAGAAAFGADGGVRNASPGRAAGTNIARIRGADSTTAQSARDAIVPIAEVAASRIAVTGRAPIVVARTRAADTPAGDHVRAIPTVLAQAAAPRLAVARTAQPGTPYTAGMAAAPQIANAAAHAATFSKAFASAMRGDSGPGMLRHALPARRGREDAGAPAQTSAVGPVLPARAAAEASQLAATRLAAPQPPVSAASNARTAAPIVPARPFDGPAARRAAPVRVTRQTPLADRAPARPADPPRRTVPALVNRQRPADAAAAGGIGAGMAQPAAAAVPPAAPQAAPAARAGQDAALVLPVNRGITPVARQTIRRNAAPMPLTVRRSLPSAAASAAGAAGPISGAAAPGGLLAPAAPTYAGAALPAAMEFADAGRQPARAAEAVAAMSRANEFRRVQSVPLEVAFRPSARKSEASPVIRELKNALRGVEKELSRMKEEKSAPTIDYKRLADDVYRAVNRRFRMDQYRRGF